MGGLTEARSRRRYRRGRRLRSNQRGLVAVIGTLLALLVFFALFGVFLTQYVPLWMSSNESAFTSSAQGSFAQLKSDIDTQYIFGGPPTMGVPFQVSSQGVPLIAQPTQGTLEFLPQTCPGGFYAPGVQGASKTNYGQPVNSSFCVFENQSLSVGPGGSKALYLNVEMGVVTMILPNRYYPAQELEYEADGVIQTQTQDYELMAYAPPLNVSKIAGNTTVSSSFVQMYGNSSIVIGQGAQEVYSHLRFDQHYTSRGSSTTPAFNYTFEIGTQFPCAWSRFIQHQLNVSAISSSQIIWSPYTGSCVDLNGMTTKLTLELTSVNYASIYFAGTVITVGIGSS